jgi:hypothetical protein
MKSGVRIQGQGRVKDVGLRGITRHGYFGSGDFRVQGEPGKLYDIDVWIKPIEEQRVLMDIKTHRALVDISYRFHWSP